MFPFFGDGIFTQEGDAWKHSRELLRPQFAHKQYDDLELFREVVDDLITILPEKGMVDLQPLFFRLTLDTTTAFLFGDSVNSLQASNTAGEATFASAFNTAQDFVAKRMRLQDLYWLVGGKGFAAACDDVHRFADQIIDRNLSRDDEGRSSGKYVFLDFLEKNTSNRTELRSQIINILVAGRDTTACLLSWTFFLLVRHPKVLAKLREEISSTLKGSTEFTRSELRRMNYLHNVLKESKKASLLSPAIRHVLRLRNVALRLYPSVPVNSRTAIRTTMLPVGGGPELKSPVFVAKGEGVAYSVYSMHRRPDLYGMDAELFRPERWEEDLPLTKDPVNAKWGYLPFNGGPRICLGSESSPNLPAESQLLTLPSTTVDFGLNEAAYTIVRLVQRFSIIQLPQGEKVELVGVEKQTMTLVLSITEGCNVELSR
ncbi:MAG: hypothetical protein Q9218_003159 [Villophora microphyllina]